MSCPSPFRPILAPTLLGRDGVRRAFTLVAPDRPGLTLDAWIAEHADELPDRDRPLTSFAPASETLPSGALPRRGLVGLSAPTGCLFAVFGYSVPPHARLLVVRGPSWNAPLGGRLVTDGIADAIRRLAAGLGCTGHHRRPW